MAAGVQHIHSNNLVHHDLKPENVLICKMGGVSLKISDFGCNKQSLQGQHYLPPEVLRLIDRNEWPLSMSKATDIFALGCTFFKFLTKENPFGEGLNVVANISAGRSNLKSNLNDFTEMEFVTNEFVS
jgi:serine/threonine protein kinase